MYCYQGAEEVTTFSGLPKCISFYIYLYRRTYSGIPIYFALKKAGLNVWLGNLTFAQGSPLTSIYSSDAEINHVCRNEFYDWREIRPSLFGS